VSGTPPSSIAKSMHAAIVALPRWYGPLSAIYAPPRPMALLPAHARSVHRVFPHVPCAGCSRASDRISKRREQTRLDQLLSLSLEVQTLYALLQAFLSMVRERKHQDLRSWMRQASTCGIPELGSFVTGIEQDYDAVHAALRLPWSQGITEGKVNKLKTLKRVMYGRAGFPLLRQRLLHDA